MATNTLNKVGNFIESLELPKSIAESLLKTVEDCQHFYSDFYNRNRHVTDDLLDYREYKIENSKITLDLFLKGCYTNISQTFEDTFLQTFSLQDINNIQKAIADGRITLEYLYKDFKNNPNKNILKNVL